LRRCGSAAAKDCARGAQPLKIRYVTDAQDPETRPRRGGERKDRIMSSIQDRVIAIIAEQAVLEPADVTLDSTLEDLGIDSLGLVESIFAIEEAFDISVPFNANEPEKSDFDISSVRSIIAGIERLIAEQA
jgi:acyl carrier protein